MRAGRLINNYMNVKYRPCVVERYETFVCILLYKNLTSCYANLSSFVLYKKALLIN